MNDSLPLLLYDTLLTADDLRDDRPYRNAGDLLVRRAVSNRDALRLCGAGRSVTEPDGGASDYERFSALCTAFPLLAGHPAANDTAALLKAVFGYGGGLSPFETDPLWQTLNDEIEKAALRPSGVLSALGVESLCYRRAPCEHGEMPVCPGVDLYPILDLGTPDGFLAGFSGPSSGAAEEAGLDAVFGMLESEILRLTEDGGRTVALALPYGWRFRRNTRRREVDGALRYLKKDPETAVGWSVADGLTPDGLNELRTEFLIRLAGLMSSRSLFLRLEVPDGAVFSGLFSLFRYLHRNGTVPETGFVCRDPLSCLPLLRAFSFRTEKGLPGLIPIAEDPAALAGVFPIGASMLFCGEIRDFVSVAGVLRRRETLSVFLSDLGRREQIDPETLSSLGEDVVYGNIKNRFSI